MRRSKYVKTIRQSGEIAFGIAIWEFPRPWWRGDKVSINLDCFCKFWFQNILAHKLRTMLVTRSWQTIRFDLGLMQYGTLEITFCIYHECQINKSSNSASVGFEVWGLWCFKCRICVFSLRRSTKFFEKFPNSFGLVAMSCSLMLCLESQGGAILWCGVLPESLAIPQGMMLLEIDFVIPSIVVVIQADRQMNSHCMSWSS